MPIDLHYDAQRRILFATAQGQLKPADFAGAYRRVASAEQYPADVDTVWDLREMEFHNVDLAFGEKLIELRQVEMANRGHARVALVSDYELAQPLLRLYEILSSPLPQQHKVCQTMGEALSWLGRAE